MSKRHIIIFICFIFFISSISYSNGKTKNTTWVYSSVSNVDILGNHDSNAINQLNEIYNKVVIDIGDKKLTINNGFLENALVCSTDYVEIKKTPLSYYLSQKTVDLYEELFEHEDNHLPKYIYILTSLYPEHECPTPYSEIIEVNSELIIADQNYMIFFKQIKPISEKKINLVKKENWSTYCHNVNPAQGYDGSSQESCYFKDMSLKIAYEKLLAIGKNDHNYLREDLPLTDDNYKMQGKDITYQWINGQLNVLVIMDNERINYSFNEQPSGVHLEITNDTQY